MNGIKRLASFIMVVSVAMGSSAAFADATPLEDGFTEEEWERVPFAPCAGGSSVRRLKTSGDYVHIFNDPTGTFRAPADRDVTIHYLLVGGGGAGGCTGGGGGGGGGVQFGTLTIPAGGVATIEVGYGGVPYAVVKYGKLIHAANFYDELVLGSGTTAGTGGAGDATTLTIGSDVYTAPGGGGGGNLQVAGAQIEGAGTGGKGAGNAGTYLSQGGGSQWQDPGAMPSATDPSAGDGADGCETYILGERACFGGGGGGAANKSGKVGGAGGLGGGGAGSDVDHYHVGWCGKDNSGGGGGGGTHAGKGMWGLAGYGGSGIVIIRYSVGDNCPLAPLGCIDRTVDGEVTIDYYAEVSGAGEPSGAPGVGGDVVTLLSNGEFVHQFNQDGTFISPAEDVWLDFLVVGGGGGGGGKGSNYGGGGGAGGVRYGRMLVSAGTCLTVQIGIGGAYALQGGIGGSSSLTMDDLTIEAMGGGGGGYYQHITGSSGASGGGANASSLDFEQGNSSPIAVTSDRLKLEGNSASVGGGGAGRMGGLAQVVDGVTYAGDGGDGVLCTITGGDVWYAGGGGGVLASCRGGAGGKGGGADGACHNGVAKGNAATLATPNTGGGGGGANNYNAGETPGSDGASGVVILRYASTLKPVESGSVFDISQGIDVADPLENCRGETFDNRAHGGEWTRLTNGDFLHTFTNLEAAMKFTAPTGGVSSLRYLVVAGGGSGGSSHESGGGGGGGVCAGYFAGIEGEKFWLEVGGGGAAAIGTTTTEGLGGYYGEDSIVSNAAKLVSAVGGGSGSGYLNGANSHSGFRMSGGSGGGGSVAGLFGTGVVGQGCDGGVGSSPGIGGGGGGGGGGACEKGEAGTGTKDSSHNGKGGDGFNSTITGVAGVYYGGGGGGGSRNNVAPGSNGLGGGVANFGGGGSGANGTTTSGTSEAGGNGVVYIRYASAVPTEGEGAIPCGASGSDFVDFSTMAMPVLPKVVWKRKFAPSKTFEPKLDLALPDGFPLVEGEDYEIEYANNTVVANETGGMDAEQIATVTVRGIGGHQGERVLSFKIVPTRSASVIIR